ncbi:MAG: hypothetical protein LBU11_00210 [Zoogloeaceae bacterium]|nr:hypothetical protein [Zoogloeaceae bacterium]
MAITVSAYTVYWYDKSVTPTAGYGMAGRIVDAGISVSTAPGMKKVGLNGDPKVEGFIDAKSNLRVAVTDRVAGQQQPVFIHNAADGSQVSQQAWPEENLYTLVKLGDFLYAIDYDNAKVIEIDATTYAATGVSYTLENKFIPSGYQACGQALIVIDDRLYGLFAFPDGSWSAYAPSLLVRFTIVPKASIMVTDTQAETGYNRNIAPNAFSFAVNGSNLYIAAIGGRQTTAGYNADSRLQKIAYGATKLANETVYDVLTPNATDLPYDIRDISFKGSTAYVLVGTYQLGPTPSDPWPMTGKLVATTDFIIGNFTVIDDFRAGVLGYYWSAQYTPDNNRLWYTRGNEIRIYNATSLALFATLTVKGSLIASGDQYTDINDLTYVGPAGTAKLSGYRSPLQRSNTPFAQAARAIAQGRPELTEEEFQQLQAQIGR